MIFWIAIMMLGEVMMHVDIAAGGTYSALSIITLCIGVLGSCICYVSLKSRVKELEHKIRINYTVKEFIESEDYDGEN